MAIVRTSEKGRVVGNWRLEDMLGEGGFGAVYAAQHTAITERRAAVKLLHPELARQPELRRRFLNEGNAASRADHEHIVQIFDGGLTSDGLCFVVMELLRGISLTRALEFGPLPLSRAVHIGQQVASALFAAHRVGLVHRDLKPDNIFLVERESSTDFVKLLDFGVAKLLDDEQLTKAGLILGTPAYMAPEQWRCVPDIDGRADLYSLGVILFRCVTGELPFQRRTVFDWMEAHLTSPVPDPSASRDLPRGLAELIQRLLNKDRQDRIQSAAEVCEFLARCLETTIKGSHSHPAYSVPPLLNSLPLLAAGCVPIPGEGERSTEPSQYSSSPHAAAVHASSPRTTSARELNAQGPKFLRSIQLSLHDISMVSRHIVRQPHGRAAIVGLPVLALLVALGLANRWVKPAAVKTSSRSLELKGIEPSSMISPSQNPVLLTLDHVEIPSELVALGPGQIRALPIEGKPLPLRYDAVSNITVGHYAISKYEVSFGEFREFFESTHQTGSPPYEGVDFAQYGNTPINQVNCIQAEKYCAWRYPSAKTVNHGAGRLPTPAEWIFAARSGRSEYRYPWGATMDRRRVNWNRSPQEDNALVDVRSLMTGRSAQGVFHLIGNVAEWVRSNRAEKNQEPERSFICGGSAFTKTLTELTATCQNRPAGGVYNHVGFRCALDLPAR